MKLRLQLRHQRRLCRAFVLCIVAAALHAGVALASPQALVNTINVDTAVDEYNVSANGNCSLREAIQTANDNADFGGCTHSGIFGNDVIKIPAGTYNLTSSGSDENANVNADLDILESVTLHGAGPGEGNNGTSTSINGGASYNGRLIHILAGTVTLTDMTIERGHLPNQAAGAGVRSEPGTTTILTNVVVGLNVADGNAGGILNRGTMTLNGSAVTNNQTLNATQGGGGIFNDDNATLTLNDSIVENNTANGDPGHGGGIFSDVGASLTLNNTTLDSNVADDTGGLDFAQADGGAIYAEQNGSLAITQSTISNNSARGKSGSGGGILSRCNTVIDLSIITGNTAERDPNINSVSPRGGGIDHVGGGTLVITSSIISNNTCEAQGSGGGLELGGATVIRNTTISGNRANGGAVLMGLPAGEGTGGGIFLFGGSTLALVDSTVSGNESEGHGVGLYLAGDALLLNVTIADNHSNADFTTGGAGGGMFVEAGGGTVTMRNSAVAGNVENGVGNHDDCDGAVSSGGNNLWQNPLGCSITGIATGNLLFVDPLLGAFSGNGGPVVGASTSPIVAGLGTHLPANGSPLIDAGNATGCKDQDNVDIGTDQRGQPRPVDGPDLDLVETCDIGAVEVQGLSDRIFADNFE